MSRPSSAIRHVAGVLLAALVAASGCGTATGGIHARLAYSEEGGLRVVSVPGGPAREAGLREGDRVMSVDGAPVRAMTMAEVVERLRGPVGSTAHLDVVRDGEVVPLTIERVPYR